MKKLEVITNTKKYNLLLGNNTLTYLAQKIEPYKNKVLLIIDKNFHTLYKKEIEQKLNCKKLIIEASEKNKNNQTLSKIYKKLIEENYQRDTTLIALGGGIIGDITGFAAATFMRGIKYIQVPTTILAAADSSVGGKTAVNFFRTKNSIGAFWQPELVLIDTTFFKTLPKRELTCGIGEITKYAFLTDKTFFGYLTKNIDKIYALDEKTINKVIEKSVAFKAQVTFADEKETGIRKILNLGHTFAHGLEVEQNYNLKHGEAVIIGLAAAFYLSNKLGFIDDKLLEKFLHLIIKFRDKISIGNYNTKKIIKIMQHDKKNTDGKINLVLIKNIGEIITEANAKEEDIKYALENGIALFKKTKL